MLSGGIGVAGGDQDVGRRAELLVAAPIMKVKFIIFYCCCKINRVSVCVCVCTYFHCVQFSHDCDAAAAPAALLLLLLYPLLLSCCCRRVFCFIFSVFSAWVSCFRCHLVYKLFMPSTAVNSYFGISLLLCHPISLGVCVCVPRVGTNKVKSQSDKHACYIYYI